MLNKGGAMFSMVFLIVIMLVQFINAGPYGYGDSADLNYKVIDSKIYYRYGNSTTYTTSLRPKNLNWSEWRESKEDISKREVVDNNNIKVQTASGGLRYISDAGGGVVLNTQDWYYKIKVWKLG